MPLSSRHILITTVTLKSLHFSYSRVSNQRTASISNVHNRKYIFMACKEGQCDVVKAFSINLNVQHVNGMTHFDLA